jgi:hypothetical protein
LGVWQDHGSSLEKAPASQGGINEASIEPGRVAHPQISGEFVVINLAELEREGIGGTCALVKAGEGGPSYCMTQLPSAEVRNLNSVGDRAKDMKEESMAAPEAVEVCEPVAI